MAKRRLLLMLKSLDIHPYSQLDLLSRTTTPRVLFFFFVFIRYPPKIWKFLAECALLLPGVFSFWSLNALFHPIKTQRFGRFFVVPVRGKVPFWCLMKCQSGLWRLALNAEVLPCLVNEKIKERELNFWVLCVCCSALPETKDWALLRWIVSFVLWAWIDDKKLFGGFYFRGLNSCRKKG